MGLLAVYAGSLTLLGIIFVPETYAPLLLRERAKLLSKVTGKVYMTGIDIERPLVVKDLMKKALIRPWALLFLEPIVFILTVCLGDPTIVCKTDIQK